MHACYSLLIMERVPFSKDGLHNITFPKDYRITYNSSVSQVNWTIPYSKSNGFIQCTQICTYGVMDTRVETNIQIVRVFTQLCRYSNTKKYLDAQ